MLASLSRVAGPTCVMLCLWRVLLPNLHALSLWTPQPNSGRGAFVLAGVPVVALADILVGDPPLPVHIEQTCAHPKNTLQRDCFVCCPRT